MLPFRKQPGEHTLVIQRLEHRHRIVARTQQAHEPGALPHVPRGLAGRTQPGQRRAIEGHRLFGRRARGLERAQRGHRSVGVGVDVHAAVAQPHAFGQGLIGRGALRSAGPRACRARVTTCRPRSKRPRAALAQIVHERIGRGEPELGRDRVLFLQREPVGVRVRDPLQRDPDVEQQLAAGLDARQVGGGQECALDQRCGSPRRTERPTRPFERLQVAEPARAFLQIGFEHLRDGARPEPAQVGGIGEPGRMRGASAHRELAAPLRSRSTANSDAPR